MLVILVLFCGGPLCWRVSNLFLNAEPCVVLPALLLSCDGEVQWVSNPQTNIFEQKITHCLFLGCHSKFHKEHLDTNVIAPCKGKIVHSASLWQVM